MENQPGKEELLARLELLLKRQDSFVREINELKAEIYKIKATPSEEKKTETPVPAPAPEVEKTPAPVFSAVEPAAPAKTLPKKKSDLEKFIGENLINKIGIIITILGVGIGAKYSVENELISPLTRILLGYFSGLVLLGFGIKFRKNYENYSAVLVSGAIAIMYFITYAAYGFYELFSQGVTFGLMLLFTAATVVTALKYNRQVIAHIGMVGAYAIPFLLSSDSGRAEILFSYMAIINVGILAIAFKRYWKPLFYVAFGLTWLIFLVWLYDGYKASEAFYLALGFSAVFFIIFYLTVLGYKLLHKEKYNGGDVSLLLANSFLFFGTGYFLLSGNEAREQFLGLFTIGNAAIHAGVSLVVNRQKQADRNLFYFITGLALVFVTMAIPVELDATWVTLLWAGEAALLFWIGRTQKSAVYEKISYVVMGLAFISILEDWENFYSIYEPVAVQDRIPPLFNIGFLTSVFFIAAFGLITLLQRRTSGYIFQGSLAGLNKLISLGIPAVLLFSIYYAFRLEIAVYWEQLYLDSRVEIMAANDLYPSVYFDYNLQALKTVWIINYSLLFLAVLSAITLRKLKSHELGMLILLLNVIALIIFFTQGLVNLGELRQSHLTRSMAEYFETGPFYVWIRYLSIGFTALLLTLTYKLVRADFINTDLRITFDLFLHVAVLTIASSELFIWINNTNTGNSFKLGLSILWGIYALFLIILGIKASKKHLRLAAIVLFAATLVKLFIYDISHLDTISKTVVFVCLGVLLLIISFLYNKYKHLISMDSGNR